MNRVLDDELGAGAAQALKSPVDDVAFPADVMRPGLTFLFDPGIRLAAGHVSIVGR